MTVTPIAGPQVQSAHYDFDTEDEAQMFVAGVREDLANEEFFDYVDHNVHEGKHTGNWYVRIDYIDRTPPGDEAA